MTKDTPTQFKHFIGEASHILILLPAHPSNDALGAGHALAHILTDAEKKITLAYAGDDTTDTTPPHTSLLSTAKNTVHSLRGAREMVLSFDTTRNKISHVRTEKSEKDLTIYITPEKNIMDPRDFSFAPAQFPYDLVIACGAQQKESFGKLYEQCPDIFYEIPIINIDVDSSNDQFGQVNYVDVTASSLSELVFLLLQKTHPHLISAPVAQDLLFGLISATNSFQDSNTTPQALHTASTLIELGADQQRIIKHLYKTQSLGRLKLWGTAMVAMDWDEAYKMLSLAITQKDFIDTKTTPQDLYFIIDKVKQNYSLGKIFLILYEDADKKIRGLVDASRLGDMEHLKNLSNTEGKNGMHTFTVEEENLEDARATLTKRLFV